MAQRQPAVLSRPSPKCPEHPHCSAELSATQPLRSLQSHSTQSSSLAAPCWKPPLRVLPASPDIAATSTGREENRQAKHRHPSPSTEGRAVKQPQKPSNILCFCHPQLRTHAAQQRPQRVACSVLRCRTCCWNPACHGLTQQCSPAGCVSMPAARPLHAAPSREQPHTFTTQCMSSPETQSAEESCPGSAGMQLRPSQGLDAPCSSPGSAVSQGPPRVLEESLPFSSCAAPHSDAGGVLQALGCCSRSP